MDFGQLRALGLKSMNELPDELSKSYLAELEVQCAFPLPKTYRDFLNEIGASIFVKEVVFRPMVASPWAIEGAESVDLLYGRSALSHADIQKVNSRLLNVIPQQTLAIGHDSGSNLILLAADGSVHFFDRETGSLFLCASTFEEFLNSFEAA